MAPMATRSCLATSFTSLVINGSTSLFCMVQPVQWRKSHCLQEHTIRWVWGHQAAGACVHPKALQLCPTLCNPMDYSSLVSSVHGILEARTLEWVGMPSSRGSPQPKNRTQGSYVSSNGRRVLYH